MNARQRVERARVRLGRARDDVYAAAHPRSDVPLSRCLAIADEATRERYETALAEVDAAERAAIAAGKAWRASVGLLLWF